MGEVTRANLVCFAGARQPFEGVLAHDLEQGEARLACRRLASTDEAFVDERAEPVEDCPVANGLRRRERKAAREYADLREQALRGRIEQVVAPIERHPQGLLVLWLVAPSTGQELKPVAEA